MTDYVVTVTREVPVEAPDPRTAEAWALEEEQHYPPVIVEALPAKRKEHDGTGSQ